VKQRAGRARVFAVGAAALLAAELWLWAGAVAAAPAAEGAASARVLRYSFPVAETGFDPARINDLYSRTVNGHIYDGLYRYDYLARPFLVKPNVAVAMPEVSDDFKTWTVKIRPGIYFADDPAFNGKPRELVAQDFVYSWKRFFDPVNKSPVYSEFKDEGVIGVDELRTQSIETKTPFDYDREVEGIRAIDRYTIRFKLAKPRPRFTFILAKGDQFAAVAREVIEAYGDKSMEHPVGTGPFKLGTWRRSSLIVLERNPTYREHYYDARPNPDDAEGQALLQRFKGRRLPMVDRVEVSIIEVSQPRWLAFLNEQFDLLAVPLDFANVAAPNGKLAPNLAKRSIGLQRIVNSDRTLYYFNMEDPVVGGYTPDKVALRRAIGLATDVGREINLLRRGQAVQAQTVVAPGAWGYDPALKTENSEYSVPRAKALLDLYGYADKDGDGWRDLPDGKPLVLSYSTQPDELSRQFDEVWKKNMDAVGLRLSFEKGQWPEQLKKARAGQLMIWQLGYTADSPDSQDGLALLYGPAAGGQNLPRFKHQRFDDIYRAMQALPDGPERLALLREAQRIVVAYMPHKYNVHRIITDLTQPWLLGYRRPAFNYQFWQFVDIDESKRPVR
jgi:ABC-type transport system substrate-binding protein